MGKERRTPLNLGIGPYEYSKLTRPSRADAQRVFFNLLEGFSDPENPGRNFRSDAPRWLAEEVLPLFTAYVWNHFERSHLSDSPSGALTSDEELYRCLKAKLTDDDVNAFIPDHVALNQLLPQTYLQLVSWAEQWNLHPSRDNWCLDFAAAVLRHWLFDRCAKESKFWDRAIERNSDARWEAAIDQVQEKKFHFKFRKFALSMRGWNPRTESIRAWRELADSRLAIEVSRQDPIPGIKQAFNVQKERHIQNVKLGLKERGLRRTPVKRDLAHFTWTVHYQIGGLSLSQICELYGQPKKTVADGINRTLHLIGLPKRKDQLTGRRLGTGKPRRRSTIEETKKEHRLAEFLRARNEVPNTENKASLARAIGISPKQFRSVWVPDLLEKTNCRDFEALLRFECQEREVTNSAYLNLKSGILELKTHN